jgi:hypothetical protein
LRNLGQRVDPRFRDIPIASVTLPVDANLQAAKGIEQVSPRFDESRIEREKGRP